MVEVQQTSKHQIARFPINKCRCLIGLYSYFVYLMPETDIFLFYQSNNIKTQNRNKLYIIYLSTLINYFINLRNCGFLIVMKR